MKDWNDYEDKYHDQDRKQWRKERKIASSKDRSKFKKSDQDQLKKRAEKTVPEHSTLKRGRVLAIAPEGILVESEGVSYVCTLKGALKLEKNRMKNLVAIGDFVHIEPKEHPGEATIALVEERKTVLSRSDPHSAQREQLIAANVDQVLITTSVVVPPLKLALVDRYILAARKGRMQPIIVINKIDLLKSSENDREKELLEEALNIYRALHISIFAVSSETGEGIEELKEAMREKTSVFSGQSGVGKSSLINALTGNSLKVGDIVEKTQKGAHTTTSAQLIHLENDGFCIDTPGIKSFGLWELTKEEIREYFSEINAESPWCKYPDCSHISEPECAVKRAVEEGKISPLRFESYCALMTTLSIEHRPR